MIYVLLCFGLFALLTPSRRKSGKKQKERPWYDICCQDMIEYDIWEDD